MKKYESPEVEVIAFTCSDILNDVSAGITDEDDFEPGKNEGPLV